MDQYAYLIQRYSKKTRYQVFLLTTAMIAVLVGSIVVLQMSETDAESAARARKQEQDFLSAVCKQGKKACDEAEEMIRRRKCELSGEDCTPNKK